MWQRLVQEHLDPAVSNGIAKCIILQRPDLHSGLTQNLNSMSGFPSGRTVWIINDSFLHSYKGVACTVRLQSLVRSCTIGHGTVLVNMSNMLCPNRWVFGKINMRKFWFKQCFLYVDLILILVFWYYYFLFGFILGNVGFLWHWCININTRVSLNKHECITHSLHKREV